MTPAELVGRIILALIFSPISVIGLKNVGCGTLLLMLLLFALGVVPGIVVASVLIISEYEKTSHC